MKYVIIRDDDTNALTPVENLDRLYRPFLERGLPVNLATIPNVNTSARHPNGELEGFLLARRGDEPATLPIGGNAALVRYLQGNPLYSIVQHGCRHEFIQGRHEFDLDEPGEMSRRLDEGRRSLLDAGFPESSTFVAPYDRLSTASLEAVRRRFRILSTGWYEWRRLPVAWWPSYALKKTRRAPHWKVGETLLLSHPGCHLSHHYPCGPMLDEIKASIASRRLTVLVTHWWEYFRPAPNESFIQVLHETADYLARDPDIQVLRFDDLTRLNLSLN